MIRLYIAESEAGSIFRAIGHAPVPEHLRHYTKEEPPIFGSIPCCSISLLFEIGIKLSAELFGKHEDNFAEKGSAYLFVSAGTSEGRHLIEFLKAGFIGIANTYPKQITLVYK